MKDKEFEMKSNTFISDILNHDLEYIGAPGGEEDNGANVTIVNEFRGKGYRYGLGMYEYLNDNDLYNKDCSKLSNISINKGQDEMFSFYSPYKYAAPNYAKQAVESAIGNKKDTYRPLPDCLTIKESSIDGLGLFSTTNISKGVTLGVTHHYISVTFKKELIRTPLGGFLNHSNKPNTTVEEFDDGKGVDYTYKNYRLVTLRDIEAGEEITVDYTKELCGLSGYDGAEFLKKAK